MVSYGKIPPALSLCRRQRLLPFSIYYLGLCGSLRIIRESDIDMKTRRNDVIEGE